MRTRRVLAGVVLALCALLVPLAGAPAAHADSPTLSEWSDDVTLKISGLIKTQWYQCSIIGRWSVTDAGQFLEVKGGCTRGFLAPNKNGYLYADVPDCGRVRFHLGDLDNKDQVGTISGFMGTGGTGATGTDCGAPSQLCLTTIGVSAIGDTFNGDASTSLNKTVCSAWNVGAPGGVQDEYYSGGANGAACPLGTLLEPWITEHVAEGTEGNWRWVQYITLGMVDGIGGFNPGVQGYIHPVHNIGGESMVVHAYALPTATGSNNVAAIERVTPWLPGLSSGGGNTRMSTGLTPQYNQLSPPDAGYTFRDQTVVTYKFMGSVRSGAVGSGVPPAWSTRGAGYYIAGPNSTLNASNGGGMREVPFSESAYVAAGGDGREWRGVTIPSACMLTWGEGSALYPPVGPIELRDVPDDSAPVAPPPYAPTAPDTPVYVGPPDDCPEGSICVDPGNGIPPEDLPPPNMPDPDDSGDGGACDFSITDPTSWGGQLVCVVVKMIQTLLDVGEMIVSAIWGLIEGLFDLLTGLFIPDPDFMSGLLDSLRQALETSALGDWTGAFDGAFDGGSAGSCTGPEIDISVILDGLEPMQPFAACDGATAQAAGIVRSVTTVAVGITGGLFIARMLTSAIGVRVPTPGGREQ